MINFQKITLKNGLRVILAPMKETKAVSVLFLVNVGGRYEQDDVSGISHFLEHMFFKGSKKYPSTLDISRQLDSIGASYNAFTSCEDTGFYVRASSDHFDIALKILTDMLFNPSLKAEEISKEKGVILEEINMYQDIPQQYISDLSMKLLFGKSGLGRSVLGNKVTVKNLKRMDFLNYKNKYYQPSNILAVIAGGQGKFSWEKEIKKLLDNFPSGRKTKLVKIKPKQTNPQFLIYKKTTDQAHLNLGFRGIPRTDNRRPILKVLNNILGETMSSRLFTEVREKRGLAYYISADYWDFIDNGAIMASAGVDLKRIDEAIKVILAEFIKFRENHITDDEISKAKENLKGRMYLGLEESMNVATFLGEQELYWDKIIHPEEIIKEIFKVQKNDIVKLAKELFIAKNLNLSIIGPFDDKKRFEKILRI